MCWVEKKKKLKIKQKKHTDSLFVGKPISKLKNLSQLCIVLVIDIKYLIETKGIKK